MPEKPAVLRAITASRTNQPAKSAVTLAPRNNATSSIRTALTAPIMPDRKTREVMIKRQLAGVVRKRSMTPRSRSVRVFQLLQESEKKESTTTTLGFRN